MSELRNASTALATVVLDELVRGGVGELVLAPGSRSAPLAFAAHALAEAGRLRLHTRLDERSAAFLALGLAKTSRLPVAVLTTSGTAVANLHPAVLEASHAGVPLVVVTADRPAHLRGTGANQTTDQVRVYGDAVRAFADVPPAAPGAAEGQQVSGWRSLVARTLVAATGRAGQPPGPVHLNLQLAEPLTPDASDGWAAPGAGRPGGRPWVVAPTGRTAVAEELEDGPRTVVVAGDDAGPPARLLAQARGWPLLAEPTSGSRTGPNSIRTYRLLLADAELAGRIERVVVCGHPTLSRPVIRLISRTDLEVVVVAGPVGWTDPGHAAGRFLAAVARAPGAGREPIRTPWLEEWSDRDAVVSARLDALLAARPELTPHEVAGQVSAAVPPGGFLFVGASNPIRDLDLMAARYPAGERRLVVANRGLAGIDGTVSSAIGAALGRRDSSRALALMGDVTFLHDSNGLLVGPGEARPDLTIVVANDDGGSIFTLLEQGAPEHAGSYEKLFGTPHGADLAALCAATGTPHRRVTTGVELGVALAAPTGGVEVVEVVVRRDNRRELDAAIRALV